MSEFEPPGGWGPTPAAVVQRWSALGRPLDVPGARTVVWSEGDGEPVVLLHGVPASAFLYRRVIPELARRGFRAYAFDLPCLGLAERTTTLDLSWSRLAEWTEAAIGMLGLERFHLVVHDIGGPIGFELVRRGPGRVRSLLALNTLVRVASFRKPWVMRPFGAAVLGRLYLACVTPWVMERLMRWQGVATRISAAELRAYALLLKREDGGAGFLRMMRSFETSEHLERRLLAGLADRAFPAAVLWGERDPALGIGRFGEDVRTALGVEAIVRVPGKHFVQEDSPAAIADAVGRLAATARSGSR